MITGIIVGLVVSMAAVALWFAHARAMRRACDEKLTAATDRQHKTNDQVSAAINVVETGHEVVRAGRADEEQTPADRPRPTPPKDPP